MLITINDCRTIRISKLQSCTVLSTTETEFIAWDYDNKELKWLWNQLMWLKAIGCSLTTVMQDKLESIWWTENVNGLRKIEHVGIKYNNVCRIKACKIGCTLSADNRSNSFTKIIIGEECIKHRAWIGVCIQFFKVLFRGNESDII